MSKELILNQESEGVIGIDLGTTNSVVAYMDDKTKKPDLVVNKDGEVLTKSFIWVKQNDEDSSIKYKVGTKAKEMVLEDPDDVLSSYKPFMGKSEVLKIVKGRPFTAQHCSMLALKYMKEGAETFLNRAIPKAVISVPAYFDESQKTATMIAAKMAGIDVLGLVAEPTAASFYYATENNLSLRDKVILVFDIGGGTFDVSIVRLDGEKSMVLGLEGNPHLGGDDFDQALAYHVEKKLGLDIKDRGAREILIQLCESAKRELADKFNELAEENPVAVIDLKPLSERITLKRKTIKIDLETFEEVTKDFIERTKECVEKALTKAMVDKEDIDEVVLVGGSSRIPAVRKMLVDYMENERFDLDYFDRYLIDPDLAVGYGAAIYAKLIVDGKQSNITDICPKNLGIENEKGDMSVLIKSGSSLPATGKKLFANSADNQEIINVNIYEGIAKKVENNTLLGSIDIPVPPNMQAGEYSIIVRFKITRDGTLEVRVIGDKVYKLEIKRGDLDLQMDDTEPNNSGLEW